MRNVLMASSKLAATALAVVSLAGAASAQQILTKVDDVLVNFPDVQPIMINGRVMVPVRGVFEHMAAYVTWDATNRMVTAHRGTDTIMLPVASRTATVNGRAVGLDAPAIVRGGRTMVPLRFLSETLGATVDWLPQARTVNITTSTAYASPRVNPMPGATMANMAVGTVIPFTLDTRLTSNESRVGDRFTATLRHDADGDYLSLPTGTILVGHVDFAQAKSGDTPGILGLAFDRLRMPNGTEYPISGTLIGLDSKSVTREDGRIVAKAGAKNDNMKWVGYGAGGGALVALLTKGNIVNNALIGAALGYIFGETQKNEEPRDVTTNAGTEFGVRLTRDLTFTVP